MAEIVIAKASNNLSGSVGFGGDAAVEPIHISAGEPASNFASDSPPISVNQVIDLAAIRQADLSQAPKIVIHKCRRSLVVGNSCQRAIRHPRVTGQTNGEKTIAIIVIRFSFLSVRT